MMSRALLCGAALATLSFAPAAMACTESPTGTYTCSTDPSDPVARAGDDDIIVNVDTGARVDGGSDVAIATDDRMALTNAGTIESAGNRAIESDNDATITNTGTISALTADAINVGNRLELDNFGTIETGDDAVQMGDHAVIVNHAGAAIRSDDKGITGGDNGTVTNQGGITVLNEGIELGDDAMVYNSGTISAVEDGVQIGRNGHVINSGVIESTGPDGDGLDIDDGAVINSGSITAAATSGAGIDIDGPFSDAGDGFPGAYDALTINNSGLIQGGTGILVETETYTEHGEDFYPNLQSQIITNTGAIRGTEGTAINVGMGADTLRLGAGSVIGGTVLLGGGDDLLSFFETGYSDGYDSLFDAGDGTDEAYFAFSDDLFESLSWLGGVLTLEFGGDAGVFDLALTGFETYTFENAGGAISYSTAELAGLTSQVPLPAAIWLMGLGLGGLGLTRRRQV
ncbi:VPLPA-CTERM sorting domain-containing protein [Salipiger aestuarii]|uniref:VPLPA-CTERM sorting domain-containing protein n=1 Tax=Salipiger aestuarii TaxID=568098 RepID=UPI00123C367B|nr:VPLPA-CTERM sorting domain-containing protein [Salipiger aestuarii]KAA8610791.1 hypothetical protein AL037_11970 [Salipiger aestuarii]